jgi:hypothetical protein
VAWRSSFSCSCGPGRVRVARCGSSHNASNSPDQPQSRNSNLTDDFVVSKPVRPCDLIAVLQFTEGGPFVRFINVKIDKKAKATVDLEGFEGTDCQSVIDKLKVIGRNHVETEKPEFHDGESNSIVVTQ